MPYSKLQQILQSLSSDMTIAWSHLLICKGLNDFLGRNLPVFNESNFFWHYTQKAHLDCAFLSVMRIFDTHSDSLSLRNVLILVRGNSTLIKDQTQLSEQFNFVENDERIKRVKEWRDKVYAHRDPKVPESVDIQKDYPVTITDLENLLKKAEEIYNFYKGGTTWHNLLIGSDDYKFVLDSCKNYLDLDH